MHRTCQRLRLAPLLNLALNNRQHQPSTGERQEHGDRYPSKARAGKDGWKPKVNRSTEKKPLALPSVKVHGKERSLPKKLEVCGVPKVITKHKPNSAPD